MKRGFTIIETVIVLSISGLFAASMMVGWSININRQRYEDSVNTFKSDIQSIFSEVENPTNSRSNNLTCFDFDTSVVISEPFREDVRNESNRGMTDCIILGKFVVFSKLGQGYHGNNLSHFSETGITVANVIGLNIDTSKDCNGPCNNSIDALKATKFVILITDFENSRPSSSNKHSYNFIKSIGLQWGATFRNVTDNRADKFTGPIKHSIFDNGRTVDIIRGMMILRSPIDGSLISFATPVYEISKDSSYITSINNKRKEFRDFILQENLVMTNGKTIDLCIRNEGANSWVGGEMVYGRNKILRIGGSSASVVVDELDKSSCGVAPRGRSSFDDVIINGNRL